eukprot:CAMPEP_0202054258 /NCGR_PEP_ID=MMETSP0963-20130614/6598_1 /ASSEMBLY_ACC=CAM_ASM_000494 /TAXON_ID=4773 /ORGANISM="Schizochytrium aggregatum, Strain ATCC28209" /LENGTH=50 /DNA_ID=CAMNT_0048619667 /DNA_START=22 /DNA_END=171 /DNA_ORIENTATION=-
MRRLHTSVCALRALAREGQPPRTPRAVDQHFSITHRVERVCASAGAAIAA